MSYVKPAGFREARYSELALVGRAYAYAFRESMEESAEWIASSMGLPHRFLFATGGVVSGSAYPDDCGPMPRPVGPTARDMQQLLGVPVTLGKPAGGEYVSAVEIGSPPRGLFPDAKPAGRRSRYEQRGRNVGEVTVRFQSHETPRDLGDMGPPNFHWNPTPEFRPDLLAGTWSKRERFLPEKLRKYRKESAGTIAGRLSTIIGAENNWRTLWGRLKSWWKS